MDTWHQHLCGVRPCLNCADDTNYAHSNCPMTRLIRCSFWCLTVTYSILPLIWFYPLVCLLMCTKSDARCFSQINNRQVKKERKKERKIVTWCWILIPCGKKLNSVFQQKKKKLNSVTVHTHRITCIQQDWDVSFLVLPKKDNWVSVQAVSVTQHYMRKGGV